MSGIQAAAAELIARTAVARGLPRTVADPLALERLAGLVAPPALPKPIRSRRRDEERRRTPVPTPGAVREEGTRDARQS